MTAPWIDPALLYILIVLAVGTAAVSAVLFAGAWERYKAYRHWRFMRSRLERGAR
jgi:hypothetical protein